jgi:flavin-dependent thymidylate synthase
MVELVGYYGSDEMIAASAWTSTYREIDETKRNRIPNLLKFLATNNHMTPFEKSAFSFLVRTDLASHIHILKHRIGVSCNTESARYKEIKNTNDLYVPEDWPLEWKQRLEEHTEIGNKLYHQAVEELTPILGRQRAKESARYFRGYNTKLTCDVMFNWRSFYHFYKLRADEHAQKEIRELAEQMLHCIQNIPGNPFKYTLEAFGLSC